MRQAIWLQYICCVFCVLALASGCAPSRKKAPSGGDTPVEMRADPGYVQWLEKQAMLRAAQDMSRIVSGTGIPWVSPYVVPRPKALLAEAPVWLTVHPASLLTADNVSLFRTLAHPEFWRQAEKLGIRGLLAAPVRESGGIWGYDVSGTQALGADTVQYAFSRYAGTEDEFRLLTRAANKAGAIAGDLLVPAATGRGADFFLSARAKPEYQGIYCMLEVPKDLWPLLPETKTQWQAEALSENATQVLREKRFLPAPRVRDALGYPLAPFGWAATGEIRGMDGISRRFVYLFCESPARPVLNWTDPAAGARRVLSGAVIQQVGTLGVAFSGISVAPFIGLEPAGGPVDQSVQNAAATARDAAEQLAQEVRRYGGWTFLTDALPLPMLAELLQAGPDVAVDHAGSVSAQAALLTGDATMLRESLMAMQALGIGPERLVHCIQPEGGVDFSLVHLYGARNDAARPLRESAREAMREAVTRSGGDTLLKNDVLYTTPAGLVALAAGLRDLRKLSPEERATVSEGMVTLAAFHAMQPGVFMISGRELSGALPLTGGLLQAVSEDDSLLQGTMGAYDLLDVARQSLVTPLGMPRTQMLFGTLPEQMLSPGSFGWHLNRILLVRNHYGVHHAERLEVLSSGHAGVLVQVLRLPATQTGSRNLLLVATNFSREALTQTLAKGQSAALDSFTAAAPPQDVLRDELAKDAPVTRNAKGLHIPLRPWQTRAVLLESGE